MRHLPSERRIRIELKRNFTVDSIVEFCNKSVDKFNVTDDKDLFMIN